MKKSNLIKIFSILVISVMIISFTTTVHAENNTGGFNDLTDTLTNANGTSTNNSANNSLTGNNSNVSNNSIPVVALVFVLGISAIYAYKKIKEYRNI